MERMISLRYIRTEVHAILAYPYSLAGWQKEQPSLLLPPCWLANGVTSPSAAPCGLAEGVMFLPVP